MTELKSTLEYRTQLQMMLDSAHVRLSESDFGAMAPGIRAEILAADQQISRLELEQFMGCSTKALFPKMVRFFTFSSTTVLPSQDETLTASSCSVVSVETIKGQVGFEFPELCPVTMTTVVALR